MQYQILLINAKLVVNNSKVLMRKNYLDPGDEKLT